MTAYELIEALYGHRLELVLTKPILAWQARELEATSRRLVYDVLVSRNSRIGERPYRLTWFIGDRPQSHVDLTKEEADEITHEFTLPARVENELGRYTTGELQLRPQAEPIAV